MSRFLSFSLIFCTGLITSCLMQNFDPHTDDKEYLDRIQKQLHKEVVEAHNVLVNQTKILQLVTRSFIENKVKENLFKAVRARVEEELELMALNVTSPKSPRQGRQEEDEDDTGPPSSTTQRPRPGLLPQLANVVSAFFGSDVNVTQYVQTAAAFLPLPEQFSQQFVGAVSLIDPSRFTSSTTTTTQQPTFVVINGTTYAYIPQLGNTGGQLVPQTQIDANSTQAAGNISTVPDQAAFAATGNAAAVGNIFNQVSGNVPIPIPASPIFPPSAASVQGEEEEDESRNPEDEEISVEDDLAVLQDDLYADEITSTTKGYLDGYPYAVKYAYKLFDRYTRTEKFIPTTTEWVNLTLSDYEDDVTTPSSSRIKSLVQSGVYLYEGAREAYGLLQQINSYLDKVNERVEGAGYGADTVGIDVL